MTVFTFLRPSARRGGARAPPTDVCRHLLMVCDLVSSDPVASSPAHKAGLQGRRAVHIPHQTRGVQVRGGSYAAPTPLFSVPHPRQTSLTYGGLFLTGLAVTSEVLMGLRTPGLLLTRLRSIERPSSESLA